MFYEEHDYVADIEYANTMYEMQKLKIKNEQYIADLLAEDLEKRIRMNRSRYDMMKSVFKPAAEQVNEKYKKDRPDFEMLKSWIIEDFFRGKEIFKIKEILAMGYETYAYDIRMTIDDEDYALQIPIVNNRSSRTKEYDSGKFRFGWYKYDHYCVVEKSSWRMSDIAEFIKDKFGLDKEEK